MEKSNKKLYNGIKLIGAAIGIYYLINLILKKQPLSSMLFIGDSLTDYYNSYAHQFKRKYPDVNTKIISQTGEQTGWMLNELKKSLGYDNIVIWGGVNDIYAKKSITQAKINLQQMYDLAKKSGANVIAFTIIPTATYSRSSTKTTELTNELNNWILNNKSINEVIDVNKIINDGKDGTKIQYLQKDTLHLTDAAHNLILSTFIRII